jgi:hypothetical protein
MRFKLRYWEIPFFFSFFLFFDRSVRLHKRIIYPSLIKPAINIMFYLTFWTEERRGDGKVERIA